jgi:YbbR domain-containing protein
VISDRLLQNNTVIKVISALLALVVWSQVATEAQAGDVPRTVSGVTVSWRNLPPDLAVARVSPDSVAVTIRGQPQLVNGLTGADFDASVNLRGATAGRLAFYVEVSVPRGVQLVGVSPASVVVVLEPVIERQRTVEVRVAGRPAAGYQVGAAAVTPESVVVRGPATAVDAVVRAVANVDVGGATVTANEEVEPQLLDGAGRPVQGVQAIPARVSVRVPVVPATPTKVVPVRPQLQGAPAPGYTVLGVRADPATVTAMGSAAALAALDGLKTGPVSVAGARADVTATVPLLLPDGVTAAQPAGVSVTVHIGPSG